VRSCCVDGTPPSDPAGELNIWLDAAHLSDIPALKTFASGLERDVTAVRAALTTSWINGQAEGQISRLKMLKRTMYGRASFPLLRRRALLAA
ncbi:transposase, partial [Methylobacterium sp. BTF04]|uniref:transposase n=1 Tax=Methylobacterium sp. BTF04 TaxID=2708300 RepID=UPI001FEFF20F